MLSLIAPTLAAPVRGPYFAANATSYLEGLYWPAWEKLFLHEGQDGAYPMPAAADVPDLLSILKGVKGRAVSTDPGTTVTEGQGYSMFVAGMRRDLPTLKSLTVAWQANGQGIAGVPACGGCGLNYDSHENVSKICTGEVPVPAGVLCKTVDGAYMPGWDMPLSSFGVGSMGSAPDGDEDAVTGLIYLAELLDSEEARRYAVRSIAAFVLEDLGAASETDNSRPVPKHGDIPHALRTMYLWRGGSCWGGYDVHSASPDRNLCINPAYFSPGQWRLFRDYLTKHSRFVPKGLDATKLAAVLDSSIVWGYNTLARISCDNGLVSNWWTLPSGAGKWPWQGELKCANSGTSAGAYYSDASRIPWRVALDYLWYPVETQSTPLFDESGRHIGTFGAKEYSNRWASGWRALIAAANVNGSFPPLSPGHAPLRPDQILNHLSALTPCATCPNGFMASPYNGWGAIPLVTTFQVPLDDETDEAMQQWVDMTADLAVAGCTYAQYFDLGQEVIVSAMLAGKAWMPL